MGYMTISSKGRFSIQISRFGASSSASDNGVTTSADEHKAAMQSSSYFGTYGLDEKQRILALHIEADTIPTGETAERKTAIAFSSDELTITEQTAGTGGTTKNVWKRIK